MHRSEILHFLDCLGEKLQQPVDLTIAGGAALILGYGFDRQTADIDILLTTPPLDPTLRRAIAAVASEEELPEGWLNDAAKGFIDVLGPGFIERRVVVHRSRNLTVHVLSRQDLILMKLFAMRPADIEDLHVMAPSADELDHVRDELDRIGRFDPRTALAISLYLEQGGGGPSDG